MLKWFADRLAQTGRDVREDERGFTLIELLVVVIIIGILAAIAIPTFLGQREQAQIATTKSDVRNAVTMNTAIATGGGDGITNGNYTAGENVGKGDNTFSVSDGVTLIVTEDTIKGKYEGLTGNWTYTKQDGTYAGTEVFEDSN